MNVSSSSSRGARIPYWTVLLTIAVIYGVFSYLTPYIFDDIVFRNCYLKHNGGSGAFSLQALVDFAREVRAYDNGRLANILSPVATMMVPRWLFAAMVGAGVATMFSLMARIAGVPFGRRPYAVLLLWVSSLVLLPWRNSIMVNDYLLNYLGSSLAVLTFLCFVSEAADGSLRGWRMACAVAVAVVAGWFHEGFSVPLCGGMAVFAFSKKLRLPCAWWVLAVVFGLASLFVVFAPGTMARAGREFNGQDIAGKIKIACTVLPALLLMAGVVFAAVIIPGMRSALKSLFARPALFILFFASLFAGVIVMVVHSDPRAGWPAELYAMIVMLSFLSCFHVGKRWRRPVMALSGVLYVAVCVFFVNVLSWQARFAAQQSEIERMFEASPTGTVFYDIIDPRTVRKQTLFLPTRSQWVTPFQYNAINDPDVLSDKYYSVVPSCLARYSADNARQLDGNGGLTEFEGVLVGEDGDYIAVEEGRYSDESVYDFTCESGDVYRQVVCFRLRFMDKDGVYRMYVWPSSVRIPGRIIRADFIQAWR